jgi:hypothetical protein
MKKTKPEKTAEWLKEHFVFNEEIKDSIGNIVLQNKDIIIGLFIDSIDQWYKKCNDKVCAEAQKSFNKWSQVYYVHTYPNNKKSKEQMIKDLNLILSPEHIERSNGYKKFFDQ